MKTFKFGQLVLREDLCDRQKEIAILTKICGSKGRTVIYGPRRFGKTSLVKSIIIEDFLQKNKKSLAVYADLFQLDSLEDMANRLRSALEQALNKRAKIRIFFDGIRNYLKHFRVEISADSLSGMPTIHLAGQYSKDEKSLSEIFSTINDLSGQYELILVLDEFQDVVNVKGLEGKLRSEIQNLNKIPVILLGSKRHILQEIFHNETHPFYGFGTDVEIKEIDRSYWLPYMQERFKPCKINIKEEGVFEICNLMRDVPNAIQEYCQWVALSGLKGYLSPDVIHAKLIDLIDNKASRYIEKLSSFSAKEKKVIIAIAKAEPVLSIASVKFLQTTSVSATAARATIIRLTDQGLLDLMADGYVITDPIFRMFILRQGC